MTSLSVGEYNTSAYKNEWEAQYMVLPCSVTVYSSCGRQRYVWTVA